MFENEKTEEIFKSDIFWSFSIPMQEIFLAILDCFFFNIQKCGKIDVCSFDKMRNEYIFCNLSPNIISWLEHYSYHDVGNFNGASCWVLLQKRKAAPTFSLQSSMHEAITGIFTTRHDLHRHIFQLAVASKMTYCMASFTPWNTRVATTAFFSKAWVLLYDHPTKL